MDKGELDILIGDFISGNALSVDLYFILKTADGTYKPFVTKPDDHLRKDIIDSFSGELGKICEPNSIFELHHVLTDNENPGYYIYFDQLNSTEISKDIFSSNLKTADEYSKNSGDFSTIFGFLINLYNNKTGKDIIIFKKNMPTQAMSKSKVIGLITRQDGTFTNVQKDTVFFQKKIDLFRIDDKIIIKSYNIYENNFKYDQIIQKKLKAALKKLLTIPGLWFSENAISYISKLSSIKRRKLISCLNETNPMLANENYLKIRSYVKRYLKHEYKLTHDNNIKIETHKDITHLITFLNREINKNSVTNEVFHTPNKKLLGNYASKK